MPNPMLWYDVDGNPEESKSNSSFQDEANDMLLLRGNIVNIKDELSGNGFGYVLLKELKQIENMYTIHLLLLNQFFMNAMIYLM